MRRIYRIMIIILISNSCSILGIILPHPLNFIYSFGWGIWAFIAVRKYEKSDKKKEEEWNPKEEVKKITW